MMICNLVSEEKASDVLSFKGLEMGWIQRPPEKISNGEEFNVTYSVTATDSFYEYAVKNKIFKFRWA